MKENQNLLSFNQWSCGDYTNDLTDITRIQTSEITNKYSSLGEHSLKLSRSSSNWWVDIMFPITENGTYTAKLDLLNKDEYSIIRLLQGDNTLSQVAPSKSDDWKTITISGNFSVSTENRLRILNYGGEVFIDNVSLTSS